MLICKNCGVEIFESTQVCPNCGANCQDETQNTQQQMNNNFNQVPNNDFLGPTYSQQPQQPSSVNEPDMLANIASCCFPIVGLILYFVWKDTKPRAANSVCKWTIGGFVASFLLSFGWFFFALLVGILG